MNNSTTEIFANFEVGRHLAVTLLVLIFIMGVSGNSLVIYIFGYKVKQRRSRFETFLLILAFVDLVSSILIPAAFIYLTLTGFQSWHFSTIGCKIIPSLLQISVTVTHGALVAISWERYQALVHPMEQRSTSLKLALWFVSVGIMSLILVSPYMETLTVHSKSTYGTKSCMPSSEKTSISMLSACLNLLRDIIALTVMSVFRFSVNKALLHQWKGSSSQRIKFSIKGRRLLKMVTVIFSVLILPLDVYHVVIYAIFLSIPPEKLNSSYQYIQLGNIFLTIVQAFNSVTNVFVYAGKYSTFRRHIPCNISRARQPSELVTLKEQTVLNKKKICCTDELLPAPMIVESTSSSL